MTPKGGIMSRETRIYLWRISFSWKNVAACTEERRGVLLTLDHRFVRIPNHMRIRIRAVPISFRSRFYNRRLCRARRRRWSSRAFCCSRDTCSIFCAIRGPSRVPVRRRTRRRRNVDNLCRAGLWLWRCRSRLYEELPRYDSEKFTIPLIRRRNLFNRCHRVARNERINLKR